MADSRALIKAVKDLTDAIKLQAGSAGMTAAALNPLTGPLSPSDHKNMYAMTKDLVDINQDLVDATKNSTKASQDHVKKLEGFGIVVAAVGPMLQQAVKYGITRPYEMLQGTAGQVSRGMLEREKDAGQNITGAAAGIAGILALTSGLSPLVGAGIAAFGQFGGNALIGRGLFQKESLQAGALQTVGQMSQERVPGFRDAAMMQYGLMKQDVSILGMGGGRGQGTGMAASLTALGMSAPESQELIARAIQAGGAQGFKRLQQAGGADAIKEMVNQGIYGTDPAAIAQSLSAGLRIGFSREMMEGASRRTGLQLPEMAQAAIMARTQTYLAGSGAGNRLFTMASNTQMARDVGMAATMGTITQAAAGASGAAEGDEASSMLLYRQFTEANPGATYMDFVEARRNKETDPRWLKMIGGAARNFAGMGQMGRILGGRLLGTKPMMVGGLAKTMGEALSAGGVGEMMTEEGTAGLAKGAQQYTASDFAQTMATATKFQAEYGGEIQKTTDALKAAAEKSGNFTLMLTDMAKVMDTVSKSAIGIYLDQGERDTTTVAGMQG